MGSTQNWTQFFLYVCNKNKYKIRNDEYERRWGQEFQLKELEVGEEVELM